MKQLSSEATLLTNIKRSENARNKLVSKRNVDAFNLMRALKREPQPKKSHNCSSVVIEVRPSGTTTDIVMWIVFWHQTNRFCNPLPSG